VVDARLDLSLNGSALGSFSCQEGLFFSTRITNTSATAIALRTLRVHFSPWFGDCVEFDEPISPELSGTLAPNETRELRRFDAAGQLCGGPYGAPGCAWEARAEVATDAGRAETRMGFATFRPRAACDVVPQVLFPEDGAVISGVVRISVTVPEGAGCNNSARTQVEVFRADGRRVLATMSGLDYGEVLRWDTRGQPNGLHWITAYQNCCGVRSAPVVVRVVN
jgi:hypothetical protein